VLFAAA